MIIILLSLLGVTLGNIHTHIYDEDCKPPFDQPNPNDTTTTGSYITMKPIERCCPQCEQCKHNGGFCALRWAVDLYPQCCDFDPIEPCRDYGCRCCIKCNDDKCSPCIETGGECRKECRAGEVEDKTNTCSYHNNGTGCKCCKTCEATSECTDAQGKCVTDPNDCHQGTFASTGCCGGCYCCKPILEPIPDTPCERTGGICSETGEDCPTGYYACFGECSKTTFIAGLKSIQLGFCCIPKQAASSLNRIDQLALMMNQAGAAQQQHGRSRHQL